MRHYQSVKSETFQPQGGVQPQGPLEKPDVVPSFDKWKTIVAGSPLTVKIVDAGFVELIHMKAP